MEKTAVIFDLDGTLWDSTKVAALGWNKAFEKYGNIKPMTLSLLCGYMGKTIYEIADIHLDNIPAPKKYEIVEESIKEITDMISLGGTIMYDGIEDMFKTLSKEHEIYIVSNCEDGYIDAFLKNHKMGEYINDREFSGRTGLAKGENIKIIMERNSITKAVYVGDTMGDYIAAKDAGIDFIFASYGFGDVKEAKYVAKDTKDIVKIVEKIL